ncbi:pre-mRNA splicing factor [Artomyces pyxidatus]|uniref:Pre-mRNA splicing factor n=1 Tax=Artomyces pyxidatus TaxID=48021 RepID=A0ACB8THU8_9AGAM|nr:pre-mRNA splicing factor [Artomyces pyxidatus]
MSLVQGYSSDEDSGLLDSNDAFNLSAISSSKRPRMEESASKTQFKAAPDVLAEDPLKQTSLITRPTDTQMNVNIPYSDMTLPVQGPENPFGDRNRFLNQNALAGHVEEQAMTEHAFRAQHLTHSILGYSANPSVDPNAPAILGSLEAAQANGFATLDTIRPTHGKKKELKRKRKGKGDLEVVDGDGAYVGPWATWQGEELQGALPDAADMEEDEEEEEEEEEVVVTKKAKPKRGAYGQESSVFHGKSMTDYQGRTYMHPPLGEAPHLQSEPGTEETFIPKTCIHTWTGHTQGVSVIRLFPETGHLLLSGSMDTKIKLWDIYTHGNCLRTFHGHVKAVKDVTFSNDGRKFLSCGYDRQMKLWDTETGQCLQRFSNGKIPYVVRFHPDEDKQHIFLAGMSDKKIIQYDINTGEITQEYDQHLGPVNTITFVDENRRFVTTSDDKTIRAWDFDIPVVIKYIAEPHMHSMPAVTLHPSKKYFAAQSLDNQILIYSTDNFRQNRKKRFAGHSVAGYACQVGFSPDGKWISSGDGEGNVVFWDWKTGRIKSRLHAHSKVVIAHEWLPHETSKVVTASWDGLIKLWD